MPIDVGRKIARSIRDYEHASRDHHQLQRQHRAPELSWNAPEFEKNEKHPRWYLIMGGILLAIIAYALYTNSILMAITFILIGILGYIYSDKEPREIEIHVTPRGVRVDNYLYLYDDIRSFWIFYEAEADFKILSLHSRKTLLPLIHIPIGETNPVALRETLIHYLPERKQELTIIDRLGMMIGL